MIVKLLLIGLIMYSVGVVLICLERQKAGTALMLINPIGLILLVYMSVRVGVVKSARIYLSALWYTFIEN